MGTTRGLRIYIHRPCVVLAECVRVFHIICTTKWNNFPTHNQHVDFYNGDSGCLLCGTYLIFKYNSIILVLKGLILYNNFTRLERGVLTLWRLTKYICRTAQLTSRCCVLNIYSTDILTEYFKHAVHSPFFFSSRCRLFHNAIFFGSCNIHILNTRCAKILKKIPAPKG